MNATTPRRSFLKTLLACAVATPALARIVENSKARPAFVPDSDSMVVLKSARETLDVMVVCHEGKVVPLKFLWKDAVHQGQLVRNDLGEAVGIALNNVTEGQFLEVVQVPGVQ